MNNPVDSVNHADIGPLPGLDHGLVPFARDLGLDLELQSLAHSLHGQADQKIHGVQGELGKVVEERRVGAVDIEDTVDHQWDRVGEEGCQDVVDEGWDQVDSTPQGRNALL